MIWFLDTTTKATHMHTPTQPHPRTAPLTARPPASPDIGSLDAFSVVGEQDRAAFASTGRGKRKGSRCRTRSSAPDRAGQVDNASYSSTTDNRLRLNISIVRPFTAAQRETHTGHPAAAPPHPPDHNPSLRVPAALPATPQQQNNSSRTTTTAAGV